MTDDDLINELINSTVPISERVLQSQDSIDPFAAYLDENGEVQLIKPWLGAEATAEQQLAYINKTCQELRAQGKATAYAIAYEGVLTEPESGKEHSAIMNFISLREDKENEVAAIYTREGETITVQGLVIVR